MSWCTRDSGLGIKLLSVILCYVDLTQYAFCTVNILIVKIDNTVRGCRQVFAEPRKFLVCSLMYLLIVILSLLVCLFISSIGLCCDEGGTGVSPTYITQKIAGSES